MTHRPNPTLSLHADTASAVALCATMPLPDSDGAPDWIHLLPSGTVATIDGRGPYRVADAAALIAANRIACGDRLVLDENHATDLAAPKGEPAPARGWIVELQARDDGIWGKVDWTRSGTALMADRAYRHISPAILHDQANNVTAILRASLVNRPNLKGLKALHQETSMDLLAKLCAALGMPAGSTEDQLMAHLSARPGTSTAAALQAALDPIAAVVGLAAGADASAVLAGVQKATGGDGKTVASLQAELSSVTNRLNSLVQANATEKATAFVDAEIRRGRVGVKPLRDHYIAMHAADPARVEKEIAALPVLGSGGLPLIPTAEPDKDGNLALNADQRQAAKLLGVSEKDFAETLKAERQAAL
jgi:hypothetical protein